MRDRLNAIFDLMVGAKMHGGTACTTDTDIRGFLREQRGRPLRHNCRSPGSFHTTAADTGKALKVSGGLVYTAESKAGKCKLSFLRRLAGHYGYDLTLVFVKKGDSGG